MSVASSDALSASAELFQRRRALRQELRRKRRALTPAQQRSASLALCARLRQLPEIRRARHVALYLPNDGEIDPTPLLAWLRRRGTYVYLPVLRPLVENRLWFVRFDDATPMTRNRFGIQEPSTRFGAYHARRCAPWALDMVLLPLVGFDDFGQRMGMGGGFYDRTFAFARSQHGPRPRLMGLAHEIQRVAHLPSAAWDVPLDAIVSDQSLIRPRRTFTHAKGGQL